MRIIVEERVHQVIDSFYDAAILDFRFVKSLFISLYDTILDYWCHSGQSVKVVFALLKAQKSL